MLIPTPLALPGVLIADFSSRAETVKCPWTAVPATHVEMGEPAIPMRARMLASRECPRGVRWGWGGLTGPASMSQPVLEMRVGRENRPVLQIIVTCSLSFFSPGRGMGRAPVGQQAPDSTGSQGIAWAWAGFHCCRKGPGVFPTRWEPITKSSYHGSAGEWLRAYKTF